MNDDIKNEELNLFEGLTPINNANNGIYSIALKSGIDNDDIKNIALSGAYGSGKSSIFKTFETTYKNEYEFLNISLADFEQSNKKENIDVERSILQKMFYTVKNEDIPFSRFKRIRDIDKKDLTKYRLYGFIWLIAFFILYKNKDMPIFLELLKFDVIYYIATCITLIGIYLFLPRVISLLGSIDLSKINLKSGELDLGESKESSILNKNIDEILYFFKVTNYDVVIFEDLDRHDKNIEIYLKLREINLILNNSKEIKRKITFIYAIKDDNFSVENRTKFFDLIIPIIPFIDYSNSAEQLKSMINKYKMIKNIPDDKLILTNTFIDKICLYIDNMRLLKNIFNEFIIYKEKLDNKKLKNCMLFSMIVYKNLFPEDFAQLCLKKGLIYEILGKRNELIEVIIKKIDTDIDEIEKKIERLEKLNITDIQELKRVYIFMLLEKITVKNNRLFVNGVVFTLDQLILEEKFDILKVSTQISNDNNRHLNFSFSDLKDVNGMTYEDRVKLLEDKSNGVTEELKKEIALKEKEKLNTYKLSIKELINNGNENIFNTKFDGKGLLVFLLSNGYIDETYTHYVSHFYEESITKEDRDFILVVQGRQTTLGYDFELSKIDEIIKKFDEVDFSKKEILNYSLFEYLLENVSLYANQYIYFLEQIIETKNIKFIDGYIENKNKHLDKLFNDITKKCSWLWVELEKSNFTKDKKDIYLKYILKYVDIKNIQTMNIDNKLSKYIASKNDFLILSKEIDNKKIEAIIKVFDIKFDSLDNVTINKDLFNYIYSNTNYKLTYEFIEIIMKECNLNKIDLQLLNTKNYSLIKVSSCKELQIYIESNISKYIKEIFLLLDSNKNEDVNIVIELLNNENIDFEDKIKIINMQNMIVEDITHIKNNELWEQIFLESKLKASWHNVLSYYTLEDGIDEALKGYLNIEENYKELSMSLLKENEIFISDIVMKLSRKIIECSDLSFESFSYLLKSNKFVYSKNIITSNLSDEKIIKLIKMNKLNLTQDNLNNLTDRDLSLARLLIEEKKNEYIEKQNEFIIDSKLLEYILNSTILNTEEKTQLINNIDTDLITNDLLARLVYRYIDKSQKLNINLIIKLVSNFSDTYNDLKIMLIVRQEQYLSIEDFLELINLLPKKYSNIIHLNGRHVRLPNKDYNQQLAQVLKKRKYITSITPYNEDIKLITKKIKK